MDDNKIYHVLAEALSTIECQDADIRRLAPKASAYDRIGQILDLLHLHDGHPGAGVDPRYTIRMAMEEIHAGLVAEKTAREKAAAQQRDKPTMREEYATTQRTTQKYPDEVDVI